MTEMPIWTALQESDRYQKAICHTFIILKDRDLEINWQAPMVIDSQISTVVRICKRPFSEGGMRYAFYAYDERFK
jgi:hypothetical protein